LKKNGGLNLNSENEMNDIEQLALNHIRALARKAESLMTATAVKSHQEKDRLNIDAQKDIYPAISVMSEIDRWAEAILKNDKRKQ
jgi:hypothetical protein